VGSDPCSQQSWWSLLPPCNQKEAGLTLTLQADLQQSPLVRTAGVFPHGLMSWHNLPHRKETYAGIYKQFFNASVLHELPPHSSVMVMTCSVTGSWKHPMF